MNKIPTIPRYKSILNIFKFLKNPIPIIDQAMQEYGDTYRTYIGAGTKSIMTTDPDIIQHVLQKNHKNYFKSKIQTDTLGKYVGKGLLTSNGDYWLQQRRLIQPSFHRKKLAALVEIMNEETVQYIEQLKTRCEKSPIDVDITEEMMHLTLRIVSKSLFSRGINDEELQFLGDSVTTLQNAIIKEVRQPFLKWYRDLTGFEEKHMKVAKENQEMMLRLINERRESSEEFDDLLDMLLGSRYEDTGEAMTDQQIIDESLILFVAGHETTANALAWSFYLLGNHEEERQLLIDEIQNLGKEDLGFEDVMRLAYTRQVIDESMRIYPPAWITDRVSLGVDEINGLDIAKDEMVGIYIYGVHHSKKIWKDPQNFRPERFSKEESEGRHSFAYFPFGGGPRLCIGQQFALMEMQLVLYHLLRNFNIEVDPKHPIAFQPLVTLRPRYGIRVRISKR